MKYYERPAYDKEYSPGDAWLKQRKLNIRNKAAKKKATQERIAHNTAINKQRRADKKRLV